MQGHVQERIVSAAGSAGSSLLLCLVPAGRLGEVVGGGGMGDELHEESSWERTEERVPLGHSCSANNFQQD